MPSFGGESDPIPEYLRRQGWQWGRWYEICVRNTTGDDWVLWMETSNPEEARRGYLEAREQYNHIRARRIIRRDESRWVDQTSKWEKEIEESTDAF